MGTYIITFTAIVLALVGAVLVNLFFKRYRTAKTLNSGSTFHRSLTQQLHDMIFEHY